MTSEKPVSYSEPFEYLKRPRLRNLMAIIGPGAIIASVTIGSGELVWASRGGAVFGYQLLWCFLFAGIFKFFQVYTAARHITLTGEHPLSAWAELPGPRLWFPLLIAIPTIAVMPIAFSGIPEILATYIHKLLGYGLVGDDAVLGPLRWEYGEFWFNVWGTCVLVSCMTMALASNQQLVERVSTVMLGILLVCVIASVIVCQPDLIAIVRGMFTPVIPDYQPWVLEKYSEGFANRSVWLEIAIYLTAVGGGSFDYIGYVGMLREKRWGLAGGQIATKKSLQGLSSEEIAKAKMWTRAALFDTSISFFFVILVTLLFAILGAAMLHERHLIPTNADMLSAQESYLTAINDNLKWVYRVGVFLAFFGTIYGAFEVYYNTFAEAGRSIAPRTFERTSPRRIRLTIYAYCFFGGLIMMWLPKSIAGNIVDRMTFGAVVAGAPLCGLWCFAMLWTDRSRLPKSLQMRPALYITVAIAGVVMFGLGLWSIIVYFRS